MSTSDTVPIFDPQGVLRDVPFAQMTAAIKNGGMPGVRFQTPEKNPDGTQKVRYVPANQIQDAVKAGGKILPIKDQDIQHPGFWSTLGDDLKGMVTGAPKGIASMATTALGIPEDVQHAMGLTSAQDAAKEMRAHDEARKQAGRSGAYRAVAPLGELVGVNVPGMEKSANEGDFAGVAGHAAAVPTAMAATEGVARGTGAIVSKASPATQAAMAAAPDAVAAAVKKLPGSVLRNIPWIGDVLHDMYQAGAEAYQKARPAADKGAPFPAKPPQEVLQAQHLATGAQPIIDPAAALGRLPAPAVHQAIQELGPQATMTAITNRATELASAEATPRALPKFSTVTDLAQQINDALGGKPLKPGVPLRDQMKSAAPVAKLPEGFTAVDSSALKGYKYDPAKQEFESITNSGQHYVHGEVTPDQFEAFENADSKGKAWNDLRQSATPLAKVINGKRVPIKPVRPSASVESTTPEKKPAVSTDDDDDLTAILQKSLKRAQQLRANQ